MLLLLDVGLIVAVILVVVASVVLMRLVTIISLPALSVLTDATTIVLPWL